ncbi:MAG: MGMT family protein [Elusimicrobiota bacterium]
MRNKMLMVAKMKNEKLKRKIQNSDYPAFYKQVWLECLKIKKGHLSTYSEIARRIGKPKSARAVGNALAKNPFAPEVPCHRVIRKNGKLGGYSKGLKQKLRLLTNEKKNSIIIYRKIYG